MEAHVSAPKVVKNIANAMASQSALAVGQVAFALLTTRWLPPVDRGSVIMLLSLANMLAVLACGGLIIEGRRQITIGENAVASRLLGAYLWAQVVGVAGAMIIGFPVLAVSDSTLGPITFAALLIGTLTQSTIFVMRGALYGRELYREVAVVLAAGSALQIGGVVALHGLGLLSYTTTVILWSAISAINAVQLLTVFARGQSWRIRPRVREGLHLFGRSTRALPGVVMGQFMLDGDRVLLGLVAGPIPLAVYGAGRSLAAIPIFATTASAEVSLTRAVQRSQTNFGRLEKWTVASSLALCLSLGLAAPLIVPLLFGQDYSSAVPVTQVCMLAAFFMSSGITARAIQQARGAYRAVTLNTGAGALTMLILVPTLGAQFGAIGAASAFLVASIVLAALWWLTARRQTASRD